MDGARAGRKSERRKGRKEEVNKGQKEFLKRERGRGKEKRKNRRERMWKEETRRGDVPQQPFSQALSQAPAIPHHPLPLWWLMDCWSTWVGTPRRTELVVLGNLIKEEQAGRIVY